MTDVPISALTLTSGLGGTENFEIVQGGASYKTTTAQIAAYIGTNFPITGGSINNTPIGNITPSTGVFTTLTATSTISGANLSGTNTGDVTIGTANGLSRVGQILSLAAANGSTTGALSSTDWTTFNNKQAAGNYITALTGEVTATGPGSVVATLLNSAVIGKVLTGYVSGAGTVTATDTILQAIQKLNGNIGLKANIDSPTFTGSVGIGIAATNIFTTYNSSTAAAYTIANFISEANPTGLSTTYVKFEKGSGYGAAIGGYLSQGVGSGLILATINGGTVTDRAWLDNTGNFGIGAIAQARLHIERNTPAEMGLFINNPNASGYTSVRFGNSDRATNGDHLVYGGSNMGIRSKTGAYISIEPSGAVSAYFTTAGFFNIGAVAGYPIYVQKTATFADVMAKFNNTGSGVCKIALANTSTTYDCEIGASGNDFFVNNTGSEKLRAKTWGVDVQGIIRAGNTGSAYTSTPSGNYGCFIQSDSAGVVHLDAYNPVGGSALSIGVNTGSAAIIQMLYVDTTTFTFTDAKNLAFGTTTGTKIGTATTQKIGLWNATPIVQPTTAVAAATFVVGAGTAVNDASTFDGYTIKQVVKALRNMGALA
jgi:hypothetical protein